MLDCLLKKCVFDIMNGWNQALGLLIHLKGKNCTISAITALVLHWLSRSHRLHKQISAETKLPLPKPYRPVTTNPSYFYSAAFEQSPCLQNEVEDELLHEIFWYIWVLFSIQVQYQVNKHKKHRPGSSGGWNFQPLGSKTRVKNLDQLLSRGWSL